MTRHLITELAIITWALAIGGGTLWLVLGEGASMTTAIRNHVADMSLRAHGHDPELVRGAALNGAMFAMDALVLANRAADALTSHLLAFRDLVEAAEAAGWDGHPSTKEILDRARDAHAALTGWSNEGVTS